MRIQALVLCLSVAFAAFAGACKSAGPPPAKNVIKEALAEPQAMVIDVRTAEEFAEGHVDGAINVPLDEIEKVQELVPDKNRQLVLHCRSGKRSEQAKNKLSELGYTKLLNAKTAEAVSEAQGKALVK